MNFAHKTVLRFHCYMYPAHQIQQPKYEFEFSCMCGSIKSSFKSLMFFLIGQNSEFVVSKSIDGFISLILYLFFNTFQVDANSSSEAGSADRHVIVNQLLTFLTEKQQKHQLIDLSSEATTNTASTTSTLRLTDPQQYSEDRLT